MRRVRDNNQFPQRSKEFVGLRPGLPPGEVLGASWITALDPLKSGPAENPCLLRVAGWEAAMGEMTEG